MEGGIVGETGQLMFSHKNVIIFRDQCGTQVLILVVSWYEPL